MGTLLPALYLHGLALGDFELALRGLLGDGAPLSPKSIERLKAGWEAEYQAWAQRDLRALEIQYLWADGIYVKAGLGTEKAALLVVIGAGRGGTKHVLTVVPGYRESTESWATVLCRAEVVAFDSLVPRSLPTARGSGSESVQNGGIFVCRYSPAVANEHVTPSYPA